MGEGDFFKKFVENECYEKLCMDFKDVMFCTK